MDLFLQSVSSECLGRLPRFIPWVLPTSSLVPPPLYGVVHAAGARPHWYHLGVGITHSFMPCILVHLVNLSLFRSWIPWVPTKTNMTSRFYQLRLFVNGLHISSKAISAQRRDTCSRNFANVVTNIKHYAACLV